MSADETVTLWISALRAGKDEEIAAVWDLYFPQLVHVARFRLGRRRDAMADEEDVALSAMKSFFVAVQKDRFPNLKDREDLWRLLSEMTRRKAIDYLRRANRLKRTGKSDDANKIDALAVDVEQLASEDPTPELALLFADECEHLLSQLDEPLRQLALRKLEGLTNQEVATAFDRSVATIERRLKSDLASI